MQGRPGWTRLGLFWFGMAKQACRGLLTFGEFRQVLAGEAGRGLDGRGKSRPGTAGSERCV